MTERRVERVSLVGQVVADLSYDIVEAPAFAAEIPDLPASPIYKAGGFFVFTELPAATHTVTVSGDRFQTTTVQVAVSAPPDPPTAPAIVPLLTVPGDNELVVILDAAPVGNMVTFPVLSLPRRIRAGSKVVSSDGGDTTLDIELEAGEVMSALLINATNFLAGSIVRFVRDSSLRLRHDPYSAIPTGLTRVVGKVVEAGNTEVGIPDVAVTIMEVGDGVNTGTVTLSDVGGANIATVDLGGTIHLLGTDRDLTTLTNHRGDYNFYFPVQNPPLPFASLTLSFARDGYVSPTPAPTITVDPGQRTKAVDIALTRS